MSDQRSNPVTGVGVTQGGAAGTVGCLPPGYVLHEFTIERVLGEGGFGVVYAAIDQKLERRVAIKEYMPTALAARAADYSVHVRSSAQHRDAFEAGRRSFINEAKLLARFEHPALIKVYQFWEDKGTAYMVMPFYNAPTLKAWVKQRGAPPDEAWLTWFLDRLIDALAALHREQCLHRDVAPDNILLLADTSPLLLDFGAARRVIGDLTQALTVILKPGFAPIEQYAETAAMKQGAWTDVYALCAVAYYVITGSAPAPAVARVVHDDVVPLQTLAAEHYSQRLLAAIDAGLAVRPDARPQTMAEFRALLIGAADQHDDERTVLAPPRSAAPEALHSTYAPPPDDTTRVASSRAGGATGQSSKGAPGAEGPVGFTSAPTVPLTAPRTAPQTAQSRSMAPTQRLTRQPVPVTATPAAPSTTQPISVRHPTIKQPTIKPPTLVTATRTAAEETVPTPRRGLLQKTGVFLGGMLAAAAIGAVIVYFVFGRDSGTSQRVADASKPVPSNRNEPAAADVAAPAQPPLAATSAPAQPPRASSAAPSQPALASSSSPDVPGAALPRPAPASAGSASGSPHSQVAEPRSVAPPISDRTATDKRATDKPAIERPAPDKAPSDKSPTGNPPSDRTSASPAPLPTKPSTERQPIKTVTAGSAPAASSAPRASSSATAAALGLQPAPAPQTPATQTATAPHPPAPAAAAPQRKPEPPQPAPPAEPEVPLKTTPTNLGILTALAELPPKTDMKAPVFEGYACCNLRYSGDWISDLALLQGPHLAVGAPVKVKSYGRYRVYVDIDGKPMRLGLDYGRREETLAQHARKIVIGQDPRPRIASFPPAVQSAIARGKVLIGMTKEQVVMSLGYPPPNETKSLDAPQWKYWFGSRTYFNLVWDARGLLKDVVADKPTRDGVIAMP